MTDRIGSWVAAMGLALLAAVLALPLRAETAPDWRAAPLRLMMVDQVGCVYCAAWDAEIGPGFGQSAEGKAAPLLRVDIDGPWPDGIVLDRRPSLTPTFILLRRGVELGRVEGYVGDTYFYPVLAEMMQEAGVPVPPGR